MLPIKSRVYKGRKSISKTRLWVGIVFITLVVVVGIIIIFRSFASGLPQDIIDEVKASLVVNEDGTSTVSVASLGYKKTFSQADTVRARVDQGYYKQLMDQVMAELTELYNKKHSDSSRAPSATKPSEAPEAAPPPSSSSQTPNNAPSQSPAQTPQETPTESSPEQIDQPDNTPVEPSDSIVGGGEPESAVADSRDDLQNLDNIPTYSRTASFTLTPIADIAKADTIGIYIDNRLIRAIRPSTRNFNIDTSLLQNGVHKLDVVVYDHADNILSQYTFVFRSNNNLNLLDRVIHAMSSPFMGLFGQ